MKVFFFLLHLALATPIFSQSLQFQKQVITLKRVIEREHYSPRMVDDQFSADLFDRFIDRLDEHKLIFTADNIKELSVYRLQLDDELNGQKWNFLDKLLPLYKSRLKKADSTIGVIGQKPFDFSQSENLSKDSFQFAVNELQLRRKWNQLLKYETLLRIEEICAAKKTTRKTCLQFEAESREKVRSANSRSVSKVLQHPSGYEHSIVSSYCEVLATLFDPHTQYFPPGEKESFETNLNTEGYYFGLSIVENEKGQIELASLMPGSPAWNSGELNQGDILLELKGEGSAPIELNGASQEEVSQILDGYSKGRLEFTVRKPDGIIKKVWLAKEKIRNDDNGVKGFILKGTNNVGYIYLPGFYTDFQKDFPSSCANDVAKEVVKLKKESISALILDLRYNGGGSMQEALDMAGIFIDQGPLSQVKEKSGKVFSLKDMNRGTIYDGPLLLLVNGQSASASELLAAVLQDYNRAIIAGGNTYGKGTAQQIFPVDTSRSGAGSVVTDKNPEYGYVKITVGKFYRVSGNTTQHQGVKPDILMPEIFDELNFRESASFHSLPADNVKKNAYYQPLSVLPIASLKDKSEIRVKENKTFDEVKKFAIVLRQEEEGPTSPISLKWNENLQSASHDHEGETEMEKLQHTTGKYVPENTSLDKEKFKHDAYLLEINKRWLKRVANDIYIEEAFNILSDYIALIANKTN